MDTFLKSACMAVVGVFLVGAAVAQEQPVKKVAPPSSSQGLADRGPINVKSRDLEVHRREGFAIFTNDVVVTQGEWKLLAEKVTVYFGDDQKDIQKFRAEKNVRFFQENRRGTSNIATYTKSNDTLVMEGNPVLFEGDNRLTGNRIFYEVGNDVMRVEKAVGTFEPKDREQKGASSGQPGAAAPPANPKP